MFIFDDGTGIRLSSWLFWSRLCVESCRGLNLWEGWVSFVVCEREAALFLCWRDG